MKRDPRPNYVGNCPLFIRAQASELGDLDPYYAAECHDIAMAALPPSMEWSGDYRAALYYTIHSTAGLP